MTKSAEIRKDFAKVSTKFRQDFDKISPRIVQDLSIPSNYILGHPLHPRGKISTVHRGVIPANTFDFS